MINTRAKIQHMLQIICQQCNTAVKIDMEDKKCYSTFGASTASISSSATPGRGKDEKYKYKVDRKNLDFLLIILLAQN